MAAVAGVAVIAVAADLPVVRIRGPLRVARGAREHGVVRRIRVAGRAGAVRISVIRREVRVVEGRPGPGGSGVAGRARGGESRLRVAWVVRAVVVREMARHARRTLPFVHSVPVARICLLYTSPSPRDRQ